MPNEIEEFAAWLEQGQERGWASKGFCMSHDGSPLTEEEQAVEMDEEADEDVLDRCIPAVRLFLPES